MAPLIRNQARPACQIRGHAGARPAIPAGASPSAGPGPLFSRKSPHPMTSSSPPDQESHHTRLPGHGAPAGPHAQRPSHVVDDDDAAGNGAARHPHGQAQGAPAEKLSDQALGTQHRQYRAHSDGQSREQDDLVFPRPGTYPGRPTPWSTDPRLPPGGPRSDPPASPRTGRAGAPAGRRWPSGRRPDRG